MNQPLDQTNKAACLVHDWLVAMRGGEKVLESIAKLFPEAPIYTLFVNRGKLSPYLKQREIRTSFLQWLPGIHKYYRWLLPLFPLAIQSLNIKSYDLVISSSHCVAKDVRSKKNTIHICYCHTPMRYLWGFEEEYFGNFKKWIRHLIRFYFNFLKKWDVKASRSVTVFIANSKNTADKIKTLYDRDARIIHPPVKLIDDVKITPDLGKENYFLIVSALVPYKRIDLAIDVCNELRAPLKIIGDGPLREKLLEQILFDGIRLEGWVDENGLWKYYADCKALLMPGEEDFGIVPLEAQMFGKPVIAYGKGGALETVLGLNDSDQKRKGDESTGIFFYENNKESFAKAIRAFEQANFNPEFIRSHAKKFGEARFQNEFLDVLRTFSHS